MPPAKPFDQDRIRRQFTDWLQKRSEGAVIVEMTAPATGASNGTFLIDIREASGAPRRLVLRVQPEENQFLDPDVIFQSRVIRALEATRQLPVPHVVWTESSAAALGQPFFVMDRIDGRVLSDSHHQAGWACDLRPDELATMYRSTVGAFAALHSIPLAEPFHFLRRPGQGTALERHMQWLQRWHSWAARGRRLEIIDDALHMVLNMCPEDDSECILWGDARPGNMIFSPDLSVAAVLDWELATTGPAGIDLGWWLMFEESQTTARGLTPLAGVPAAADIVSEYEMLTGAVVPHLPFYRILAALQFAIIVLRYVDMQVAAGLIGADTTMGTRSPVTAMLARMVGLEPPEPSPDYERVVRGVVDAD